MTKLEKKLKKELTEYQNFNEILAIILTADLILVLVSLLSKP